MTKPLRITGEEQFFLHLNRAWVMTQKYTDAALKGAGLTVSEYMLLRIIENTPSITAGEARERIGVSAPTLAQLVMQLETKQLLRRKRDKDDARRLPLALTPKGTQALTRAKRSVAQLLSRLQVPGGLLDSVTRNLSIFLSSLPPYGAK